MSDDLLVEVDDAFSRTDQALTPREALVIRAPVEAITFRTRRRPKTPRPVP
jgi:hypothetical protein